MDAMLKMGSLPGINPNGMISPPRCAICPYQPINAEDNIRHQMRHIMNAQNESSLASLYHSLAMPTALRPTHTLPNEDDEVKPTVNEFRERPKSEENEHFNENSANGDDHIMSDVSGESQSSPLESGKSSGDEGCSPADEAEDKGARKRKAGLKLNQIAARLHEKNSPGVDESCAEDVNVQSAAEKVEDDVSMSIASNTLASALAISAPVASLPPSARVLPPLLQSELGNLNIFQQACIAHVQDMEQKYRSVIDMWRFTCQHCKMAFHDEPLFHIHMGYHGYDHPFKCNRCGQSCTDGLTFNLHLLQAKH